MCIANASSQTTVVSTNGSNLPGSWLAEGTLISKSDVVFVGKILNLSIPDSVAAGGLLYGANVEVARVLKGVIAGKVVVSLRVTSIGPIKEGEPKINHTYVFFATVTVSGAEKRIDALKLIDATNAAVQRVADSLNQGPK